MNQSVVVKVTMRAHVIKMAVSINIISSNVSTTNYSFQTKLTLIVDNHKPECLVKYWITVGQISAKVKI